MTKRTIALDDFQRTAVNIISAAAGLSGQEFIAASLDASIATVLQHDVRLRRAVEYATSAHKLGRPVGMPGQTSPVEPVTASQAEQASRPGSTV